jgi:hypothetical protein
MQQRRRISLQAAAGRQYSQAMIMRTESAQKLEEVNKEILKTFER